MVVVTDERADLDLVGEAVERGGTDECGLVEARVFHVVRRDVGELEQRERVARGVGAAHVELLAGLRARELPVGVVLRALDAPGGARGGAYFEGLDLLHLEGGAVDPVGALRACLGEGVGDYKTTDGVPACAGMTVV